MMTTPSRTASFAALAALFLMLPVAAGAPATPIHAQASLLDGGYSCGGDSWSYNGSGDAPDGSSYEFGSVGESASCYESRDLARASVNDGNHERIASAEARAWEDNGASRSHSYHRYDGGDRGGSGTSHGENAWASSGGRVSAGVGERDAAAGVGESCQRGFSSGSQEHWFSRGNESDSVHGHDASRYAACLQRAEAQLGSEHAALEASDGCDAYSNSWWSASGGRGSSQQEACRTGIAFDAGTLAHARLAFVERSYAVCGEEACSRGHEEFVLVQVGATPLGVAIHQEIPLP